MVINRSSVDPGHSVQVCRRAHHPRFRFGALKYRTEFVYVVAGVG
jgi:hypothetical protein